MRIIVTGSLAYDYIMNFPGKFADHILPDKVHMLTVSFLVDSMKKMRGGTAGNIAYTLSMLNAKAAVVSAAGQDFAEYRDFMTGKGIDVRGIKVVPNEFTASCFINTDQSNNQIVAFYPGAVVHAREVTLASLGLEKGDWVIISPTDPESMAKHTAECKKAGVSYIFDPGKQVPRLDKAQILSGLDGCAAFVGNDYEFGMMAKSTGLTEQQLFDMAPLTVMTRGDQGSRFIVKGKPTIEIPIAKPSAVVDPTGAGDAYLGALAFGLSKNLSYEVTGRIAALAATYAIELKGCQEHFFSVDDFARRYQATFGQALNLG
ncbi:MAG: carbohydrate kinase family protein [Archangium sp.]|nr:carbohydrate kinase family protein [Archangium sp.]MDP3155265.1 carbohydrate kinase family protein [Archangium sp.]MDP3570926.1 carbohydrate kinase family protein [Archangium sp.]